jgi:hypothetical protein
MALSNLMRTTTWLMMVVPFLVLMGTTQMDYEGDDFLQQFY